MQRIGVRVLRRIVSFRRSRWHRLALLACISTFVLVVVLSFAGNHKQDRPLREIYKPVDVEAIGEDVLKVHTGIYVNRIHDVDRTSGTFSANGWLWMSWDRPRDDDWREGEISIDTIKFMNEIPNASKRDKLIENPQEQYAGRMWQSMRFSSKFLMNNQDFSRFPFENVELPIEVGSDAFAVDDVVYLPNLKDSLVSDRLSLSGFEFRGLQARNFSHSITSKWGHSIDPASPQDQTHWAYPHLEWVMQFSRLSSSSIARLFTPVFAAMVVLMFSLLVNLNVASSKISIPASVLLVLAVLQDRSHKLLPPDITYLTYMDKIYMFCYVLTLISFLSSLYCVNRVNLAPEESRPALMISLRSHQRALVAWMCLSLIVMPLILWIFQFD